MPTGALSIAAGREATGKSSFGVWTTAQVTTGSLPGHWLGAPRNVLYVAVEDSWQHTLKPRLQAAGADTSRVATMWASDLTMPRDIDLLREAITDIALVVLDPLLSLMDADLNENSARDVRQVLDPLAALTDQTGAVVLGIAHFNKSQGRDAASKITGSGAFKDVARAVFAFAADGERRVMTQVKNSLGRADLSSLSYGIEAREVAVDDGGLSSIAALTWLGESDVTVDELTREIENTATAGRDASATGWLREYLTARGGSAPRHDVINAGKAAGYPESTLKRHASNAGVRFERSGFGKGSSWTLSSHAQPHPGHVSSVCLTGLDEPNGESGGQHAQPHLARSAHSAHSPETGLDDTAMNQAEDGSDAEVITLVFRRTSDLLNGDGLSDHDRSAALRALDAS
jgi:hypothetical protein